MAGMCEQDFEYIQSFYNWLKQDPQISSNFVELCSFALLAIQQEFTGIEVYRILEDTSPTISEKSTGIYKHACAWHFDFLKENPTLVPMESGDSQIIFDEITLDIFESNSKLLIESPARTALKKLGILIDFTPLSEESLNKLKAIMTCVTL